MRDVLRLRAEDVDRFAVASGDLNPLHVDPGFARRTPFGRTIAHGALAVIAALASVPASQLTTAGRLTARFLRPMLPGVDYRITAQTREDGVLIVAREGDMPVLSVSIEPGPPLARAARPVDRALPGTPETCELSDRTPGQSFSGDYGVRSMAGLRDVAAAVGASAVPDALLGALAWSSWFVGMRFPGRDSLFSGLRIESSPEARRGSQYHARVRSADLRTGAVAAEARCADLDVELHACHRPPVPRPTWASATAFLPPGDRLAGSRVLVVGGGRGLGAAIVSVLAAQGATVWATQRSPGSVEALQREFGSERVRPLLLEAADAGQVRSAFGRLDEGLRPEGEAETGLDGVVLCAGPSVMPLTLHPDNVQTIRSFVDASLDMALIPLAESLGRLAGGGWLAVISSSAVEDMPEQWPHYAVAKSAVEAIARHCAYRRDLKALIARPPKMWTDMSNGPLGRIGAIPTERVASAIADWVLRRSEADPVTVLGSAFLASWDRADRRLAPQASK